MKGRSEWDHIITRKKFGVYKRVMFWNRMILRGWSFVLILIHLYEMLLAPLGTHVVLMWAKVGWAKEQTSNLWYLWHKTLQMIWTTIFTQSKDWRAYIPWMFITFFKLTCQIITFCRRELKNMSMSNYGSQVSISFPCLIRPWN